MGALLQLSLLFVIFRNSLSSPQCGLYGAPPCTYVPAPPGSTPTCAGPGKTYCEHVQHYPIQIIKHLISEWGHEINNLLVDETGEEFDAVRQKNTQPQFFGPGIQLHNTYSINDGYKYPNPNFNGYNYKAPSHGFSSGGIFNEQYTEPIYIPTPGDDQRFHGYNHGSNRFRTSQKSRNTPNVNFYIEPQQVTEYNSAEWLKRYTRDLSNKKSYSTSDGLNKMSISKNSKDSSGTSETKTLRKIFSLDAEESNHNHTKSRQKRQSSGRGTLCQVNTQFITPQAALNSRGNWMYVVNQVDSARQLVKAETCASSVCSNLCQVPNSYNTRCEQKYVQKRLIALNGNGQNLYTDTFWFPSCCVCTISNQ